MLALFPEMITIDIDILFCEYQSEFLMLQWKSVGRNNE